MIKRLNNKQKGFTLIELMIVIAIIGILAAIAIPQFAMYRMRSYNSSSQSDARNLATSEAAFFADWQVFGKTNAAGADAAALIVGPSQAGTHQIVGTDSSNTVRRQDIPLGRGVSVFGNTDANRTTFTAVAKHLQGDTVFGVDADTTAVYFCPSGNCAAVGANAPAAVPGVTTGDDFNGVANYLVK